MHMPYIWSTSHKPGTYVDLATYLLDHRTIFIGPEITTEMASVVAMQLLALSQDNNQPISLYINCYGGSVPAGLAIMDMVNSVSPDVPVHTYCIGECVGIAVTILVSGKQGERRAFPSARISLFQEWYGVESLWGAQSYDEKERKRLMETVTAVLTSRTRLSEAEPGLLHNMLSNLEFLDARQALDLRITDHLVGAAEVLPAIR